MWSRNPGIKSLTSRIHTKNITGPRSHPHPDDMRKRTVVFYSSIKNSSPFKLFHYSSALG